MTKTDLNRFRKILTARQTELEGAVRKRDAIVIEINSDSIDQISHTTERELAVDKLERESSQLRAVRGALGRIEDGSFGTCVDCEEKISKQRLAAVPWTRSCLSCQEAADRAVRQPWTAMEEPLFHAT
jgi:DnaK suppressor protein